MELEKFEAICSDRNAGNMYASYIGGVIEKFISDKSNTYKQLFVCGNDIDTTLFLSSVDYQLRKSGNHKVYRTTGIRFLADALTIIRNENIADTSSIINNLDIMSNDILVIENVEYFAGKEKCQEILYVIVDRFLETNNKRLIVTSKMFPRAIQYLEERNVVQFEGFLLVNLWLD